MATRYIKQIVGLNLLADKNTAGKDLVDVDELAAALENLIVADGDNVVITRDEDGKYVIAVEASGGGLGTETVGTTTQPVYVSGGAVKACSRTIPYITLNGSNNTSPNFYASTSAPSSTTSKRYLLGSSTTSSLSTTSTNTNCFMKSGKLYSNGNQVAEMYTGTGTTYSIVYPVGTYLIAMGSGHSATSDSVGYNTSVTVYACQNVSTNAQAFANGGPFRLTSATGFSAITGSWRVRGMVRGVTPSSTSTGTYYTLVQRVS